MDTNVKDVLLGLFTLVGALGGALGGVWLGQWLERRFRHDAVKRDAYAKLAALTRDAETDLRTRADGAGRDLPVSETWGTDVLNAVSLIEVVGSADVVKKATALVTALGTFAKPWMADASPEVTDERKRVTEVLNVARREYVDTVRRDLGAR